MFPAALLMKINKLHTNATFHQPKLVNLSTFSCISNKMLKIVIKDTSTYRGATWRFLTSASSCLVKFWIGNGLLLSFVQLIQENIPKGNFPSSNYSKTFIIHDSNREKHFLEMSKGQGLPDYKTKSWRKYCFLIRLVLKKLAYCF